MKFKLLAGAALLGCSSLALAQPYIGASFGKVDYDEEGVSKPTGFDLYAGFKVNEYFALEGVYTDLGNADIHFQEQYYYYDGYYDYLVTETYMGELSVDSIGFAGKVIIPVGDVLELYARGGFHAWDAEISGAGGSASEDGTDPFLGFGLTFKVGNSVGLGARYTRYDLEDDDVSMTAANIELYF
ncbi:MAG TPA: porin family protein [Candidatus Kapabacteria bacterium]|nr:porin family protein [Candidatus Kapabacteria bacterium]